jgi:hypothetical protein
LNGYNIVVAFHILKQNPSQYSNYGYGGAAAQAYGYGYGGGDDYAVGTYNPRYHYTAAQNAGFDLNTEDGVPKTMYAKFYYLVNMVYCIKVLGVLTGDTISMIN